MDIPEDIQNKLKCSECNELLSCGPVFLIHRTGGAICGRCSQQQSTPEELAENNDWTRNGPYEATASFLAFPCVFAVHGCTEKISFALGQPPHETNCKFRPYICPIGPHGSCDWTGPWIKLKEHFDEKHTSNVLKNPCEPPRPDLTTSNLQSYLISAFNFLFLLQLKVCLTSGKLFHCVRMYGDQNYLDKFTFKLDVEGNEMKFAKSSPVLRPGILTFEEPSVVYTTLNSLGGILSGNKSKFTMRIKALFKYCVNCFVEIDSNSESQFCDECEAKLNKCKFHENNCLFVDVEKNKCAKHEVMFCVHQTKCTCGGEFFCGSLIEHLESSSSCRKTSKSNIDAVFRLTRNIEKNVKVIIFSSKELDTVICEYRLYENKLLFQVFTSLPSHDLNNFECSIKLKDPITKFSRVLTPVVLLKNTTHDWFISEEMFDYPSWKKYGIDLKINIFKK